MKKINLHILSSYFLPVIIILLVTEISPINITSTSRTINFKISVGGRALKRARLHNNARLGRRYRLSVLVKNSSPSLRL